jgi:hypothetical protein
VPKIGDVIVRGSRTWKVTAAYSDEQGRTTVTLVDSTNDAHRS